MMIDKRLLAMAREAWRYIALKVLANWVSLLAGICLWFTVARLLERGQAGAVTPEAVALSFAVAAACIALRFALTRAAAGLTHQASAQVKSALRSAIYEKLRRLGGGYSDSFPTAEAVQLAGEGVEQLEVYFGGYLPQLFYAVLAPLTLFAVFLPLSPLTAAALFVCVPLIPGAIMTVQRVAKRLLSKYWDAYANLGDSFLENLQGLTTLKVYGADEARHQQMNREAEGFRVATMKVLTMQLNSVTIMDLVAYGGTALGGVLSARAYALEQVSLGGAIAMLLLAGEFFLAMRTLGSFFHSAMNGMAASRRMFRLLDLPEPKDGEQEPLNGDIEISGLSFSYDGDKRVLSGLSLTLPRGSLTSAAGASGCGKSTLAALIAGLRTGYEGEIRIGGVELREARRAALGRLVTLVPSESYLFSGTVRQTLLEGKADASDREMLTALDRVRLLDFIAGAGGLDMALTEGGGNLSGGQRQRLALARALLKDSPIYIFDEATSNIDAESEAVIMEVIRSLKGAHTILLISHRLANGIDADEIAFLENGVLTERGSHALLLERRGGYARLYQAQRELENLRKGGQV
jgi:ABC-type transport system involved in cytochrome bd biosynthesis fused ATPase/permease subunit